MTALVDSLPRKQDALVVTAIEGSQPVAGVLVIHENRGLNPYIEDVARRLAVEGYVAFAPDALFPVGGYPGDEDQARALLAKQDAKKRADVLPLGSAALAAGVRKIIYLGGLGHGNLSPHLASRQEVPQLRCLSIACHVSLLAQENDGVVSRRPVLLQ